MPLGRRNCSSLLSTNSTIFYSRGRLHSSTSSIGINTVGHLPNLRQLLKSRNSFTQLTWRILSSATDAITQSSLKFHAKSDTLAVCPPCINNSSGGPSSASAGVYISLNKDSSTTNSNLRLSDPRHIPNKDSPISSTRRQNRLVRWTPFHLRKRSPSENQTKRLTANTSWLCFSNECNRLCKFRISCNTTYQRQNLSSAFSGLRLSTNRSVAPVAMSHWLKGLNETELISDR